MAINWLWWRWQQQRPCLLHVIFAIFIMHFMQCLCVCVCVIFSHTYLDYVCMLLADVVRRGMHWIAAHIYIYTCTRTVHASGKCTGTNHSLSNCFNKERQQFSWILEYVHCADTNVVWNETLLDMIGWQNVCAEIFILNVDGDNCGPCYIFVLRQSIFPYNNRDIGM